MIGWLTLVITMKLIKVLTYIIKFCLFLKMNIMLICVVINLPGDEINIGEESSNIGGGGSVGDTSL